MADSDIIDLDSSFGSETELDFGEGRVVCAEEGEIESNVQDMDVSDTTENASEGPNETVSKYLRSQLDVTEAALVRAKQDLAKEEDQIQTLLLQLKGDCPPTSSKTLAINRLILKKAEESHNAAKNKIKVELDLKQHPPCCTSSYLFVSWDIRSELEEDVFAKCDAWPRVCNGKIPFVATQTDTWQEEDPQQEGVTVRSRKVLVKVPKEELIVQVAVSKVKAAVVELMVALEIMGQRVNLGWDTLTVPLQNLLKEENALTWPRTLGFLLPGDSMLISINANLESFCEKMPMFKKNPVMPRVFKKKVMMPVAPQVLLDSALILEKRCPLTFKVYGSKFQILAILSFLKEEFKRELRLTSVQDVLNESSLQESLMEELNFILRGVDEATAVSDVCPSITEESESIQEHFGTKKAVLYSSKKKTGVLVHNYASPSGSWMKVKRAEIRTDELFWRRNTKNPRAHLI